MSPDGPARLPAVLPLRRIFGVPAVIAAVTIVGLVAALLGDGAEDAVSWAGLGIPVAVIAWALRFRRR